MVAPAALDMEVDGDILPIMLQTSLRVYEAFVDSELVALNDPLTEYWQRMNHGVVGEMVAHLSARQKCSQQEFANAAEWQKSVQGALYKSVLMMEAVKRGMTVEELMGEPLTEQKRESLLFSGPDFFEIKAMAEKYPDVPTGRAVLAMELLMRGIYNQVQTGVTDRQAQEKVRAIYTQLRQIAENGALHRDPKVVETYTNQKQSSEMLRESLIAVREKLGRAISSMLIVGPGDAVIEKGVVEELIVTGVIDQNVRIVGIDPEPTNEQWDRMTRIQSTVEDYTDQNKIDPVDCLISWGSGPHNEHSMHSWIRFWRALQKMSGPQTITLIEAGMLDVGDNKRLDMALEYNRLNPGAIIGAYGLLECQRYPGSKDDEVGVIMFPIMIYELMTYLSGGELLSSVTTDPQERISDNPFHRPFYSATNKQDIRGVMASVLGQSEMLAVLEKVTRPLYAEAGQTVA